MLMRGDSGDAMARMKRWDAVRQRIEHAASAPDQVLEEVVRSVGEVVNRHPGTSVTVTVEEGGPSVTLRITHRDGQVDVSRVEDPRPAAADPPRDWPPQDGQSAPSAESVDQTAARLAELIRSDPTLLDGGKIRWEADDRRNGY
jgi:hypothetical protein